MKKILFIILCCLISVMFSIKTSANKLENIKYFKTIYNEKCDYIQSYEITEREYNNVSEVELFSTTHVTEYKKLSILKIGIENIFLQLEWKKNPAISSYDVIALRGENVSFNANTIEGKQTYMLNNSQKVIRYTQTTDNTKIYGNGVGISMNLVNGATNYILTLNIGYTKYNNNAKIYGTYQHSQKNISLSQSQNYTLSPHGYGNVIDFNAAVRDYYDGMGGVQITV